MNIVTKTGEGGAEVECAFSVDIDGDVVDLQVKFGVENILTALSFEQIEQLEMECFAHYTDEAKQSNADAAIQRHLDKLEVA